MSVLCFLWATPGLCEPARVAIVTGAENSRIAQRFEAELLALGFQPIVLFEGLEDIDASDISRICSEGDLQITLLISSQTNSVDIFRILSGEASASRVDSLEGSLSEGGGAVMAIRTAEVLRTLMTDEPSTEIQGEQPPDEEDISLEHPQIDGRVLRRVFPHRKLELGLGFGPQWSPGGLDLSWMLVLNAAYMPHRRIGGHIVGFIPVNVSTVSSLEGSADIRIGLIGAGLRVRFLSRNSMLNGEADIGGGLVIQSMKGNASPDYSSREDRVFVGSFYIRPRLTIQFTSWIRIHLGVIVGVCVPRPVVEFTTRKVGHWGRPFLIWSLSVSGLLL